MPTSNISILEKYPKKTLKKSTITMRNRLLLFHNLVFLPSSMFGSFSRMAGKNMGMNLKSCAFFFFFYYYHYMYKKVQAHS